MVDIIRPRPCLPIVYLAELERIQIGIGMDQDNGDVLPIINLHYNEDESVMMAKIVNGIVACGGEPQIFVWQSDREDNLLVKFVLADQGRSANAIGELMSLLPQSNRTENVIPVFIVPHRVRFAWGTTKDFVAVFKDKGVMAISILKPGGGTVASCLSTELKAVCPYNES